MFEVHKAGMSKVRPTIKFCTARGLIWIYEANTARGIIDEAHLGERFAHQKWKEEEWWRSAPLWSCNHRHCLYMKYVCWNICVYNVFGRNSFFFFSWVALLPAPTDVHLTTYGPPCKKFGHPWHKVYYNSLWKILLNYVFIFVSFTINEFCPQYAKEKLWISSLFRLI